MLVRKDEPRLSAVDTILDSFPSVAVHDETQPGEYDITVLDRRGTSRAFVDELRKCTMVVGLDEGGAARGYCDYLVDTLPVAGTISDPNRTIPAARSPKNRRLQPPTVHESILVTFGGEDPAGLTAATCAALIDGGVGAQRITAVRGPAAPAWNLPSGLEVLENEPNLREILHRYDLVLTSFGLTAFEAFSAGVSVLLVNPTRYHTKLSDKAGFISAGTGRVDSAALMEAVNGPGDYRKKMDDLRSRLLAEGWVPESDGVAALSDTLNALSIDGLSSCPLCSGTSSRVVARFNDRSYFRCSCTGLIYQRSFVPTRRTYDEAYFSSEYKAQYGRTYLEDFEKIRDISRPRLRLVSKLLRGKTTLLDVGCAYGPFLDRARENGLRCFGTDIVEEAVSYVSTTLGIPAVRADFPDLDPGASFDRSRFDALTMWFVIEHFEDLDCVLRKAAGLIPVGGVLALSTPNCRGISGLRSITDFLKQSPVDHVTVWSPRIARRVLSRYGFRVRAVRVTGHHPERFPGLSGVTSGFFYRLMAGVSRIFALGDTFEVYAIKTGVNPL